MPPASACADAPGNQDWRQPQAGRPSYETPCCPRLSRVPPGPLFAELRTPGLGQTLGARDCRGAACCAVASATPAPTVLLRKLRRDSISVGAGAAGGFHDQPRGLGFHAARSNELRSPTMTAAMMVSIIGLLIMCRSMPNLVLSGSRSMPHFGNSPGPSDEPASACDKGRPAPRLVREPYRDAPWLSEYRRERPHGARAGGIMSATIGLAIYRWPPDRMAAFL